MFAILAALLMLGGFAAYVQAYRVDDLRWVAVAIFLWLVVFCGAIAMRLLTE
jgi:hypothetical protein